ncbi:DUF1919 domain-containing protein [Photobacterium leiognathi]|uniref:DUF1919 domain-containing protein n=1 Tax=Photobacterium leiognathi TaxID=553611 RepID=UPI0029815136|nr:DUF1919 domain-containing protein [Photobacterium leiognathi]
MFFLIKKTVRKVRGNFAKLFLREKEFSIISDNCWGGFIYQYFDIPYKTPFVGLFIFSPDYIRMLKRLDYYLNSGLKFINPSESKYKEELIKYKIYGTYPIALLGGDVEIHFLHYKTNEEARDKWYRRLKRLNKNDLIIKFCDRDLCTSELIHEFDLLRFRKKVMLSSKSYKINSNLQLKGEEGNEVKNEWKSFLKTTSPISFLNKLQNNR